jgi:hypothetical protein
MKSRLAEWESEGYDVSGIESTFAHLEREEAKELFLLRQELALSVRRRQWEKVVLTSEKILDMASGDNKAKSALDIAVQKLRHISQRRNRWKRIGRTLSQLVKPSEAGVATAVLSGMFGALVGASGLLFRHSGKPPDEEFLRGVPYPFTVITCFGYVLYNAAKTKLVSYSATGLLFGVLFVVSIATAIFGLSALFSPALWIAVAIIGFAGWLIGFHELWP